jgi:hypothetical protein
MYKPAEKLLIGMYVEEIMPCKLTVHFWAPNDVFFLSAMFFSQFMVLRNSSTEKMNCATTAKTPT